MRKMTDDEKKMIQGGRCTPFYGYCFYCPITKDELWATIEKYYAESTDKGKRYIQFTYERCSEPLG